MNSRARTLLKIFFASLALSASSAGTASAASIVNGDFETGSTAGWSVADTPVGFGTWIAYSGTVLPGGMEVEPPPGGNFAAVATQIKKPGRRILYQDVALEPDHRHQLSLTVYYRSENPLTTPSPNTLDFESVENQQYRVDVIDPAAPIDSVDPAHILTTLFATQTGDPVELAPMSLMADLTPFAGRTVRLRLAEADNQGFLAASADNVSIVSTYTGRPPSNPIAPSSAIALGKLRLNAKNGTAQLPVTVPGAGVLTITDAKAKGPKRIRTKTVQAAAAGTLRLPVQPTGAARKVLRSKGKLRAAIAVTFTPTGGLAAIQSRKLVLKLTPPEPRR